MSFAPSNAYLGLNLLVAPPSGSISTRIGAFGICLRSQVPALYPDFDPPQSGDTNGRQFTFKPTDEIFIYGKLFRTDTGTGVPGVPVRMVVIDDFGGSTTYWATTGQRLGEFSFTLPPNSLGAGSYTISLEFQGA